MKCPKCQFENRADAKFCLKCRSKFEKKYLEYGRSLALNSAFCDDCGHSLGLPTIPNKKELYFDEKIETIQRYFRSFIFWIYDQKNTIYEIF